MFCQVVTQPLTSLLWGVKRSNSLYLPPACNMSCTRTQSTSLFLKHIENVGLAFTNEHSKCTFYLKSVHLFVNLFVICRGNLCLFTYGSNEIFFFFFFLPRHVFILNVNAKHKIKEMFHSCSNPYKLIATYLLLKICCNLTNKI